MVSVLVRGLDANPPAVLCVIADFFFAIFPWVFLWKLQMNKREKIVIAASMSLGLMYVTQPLSICRSPV